MKKFAFSPEAKKAVLLGATCSVSYMVVYVVRNVLGTVSPQMIENGNFTEADIGALSSLFFITYAVGQLVNGIIGDYVKAKYMMCLGLILSGVCHALLPVLEGHTLLVNIAYGLTGFFLSMIYGPMVKMVSENTEPNHATRCNLGFTVASFVGSPLAGVLAALMAWWSVFYVSSGVMALMGVACFVLFTAFERRGIIEYDKYPRAKDKGGSIKMLIQHRIITFSLISILTGVVRTTVVFWLPTYLSQYLGFPARQAALLFTVISVFNTASAFLAVLMFERLGHDMDKTNLISFVGAALSFLGVFLVKQPAVNIVCITLGIVFAHCAATMLWSRYCPSLRDTGMVSGATGFLDFLSYMAASVSSTLFANAVTDIGWGWLTFIWFALMAVGAVICLPFNRWRGKCRR